MVDVSDKKISARIAVAESCIQLPPEVLPFLQNGEIHLKKGAVFQTAIIAGTLAAKKTQDLIPFCHSLPLDSCKFEIGISDNLRVKIQCTVKTEAKTGVEMEALLGASIAALTIYDMCKALSHRMVIEETKLISKVGGKRTVLDRPLYGLVLTGGKSTRMKSDKALLEYSGKPQAERAYALLEGVCEKVFLSARPGQWDATPLARFPVIEDLVPNLGPSGGILSALQTKADAHWFVMACDLPHVNEKTVRKLVQEFDPKRTATCFLSEGEDYPEALCAIYSPKARPLFESAIQEDKRCPVKILKHSDAKFLSPDAAVNLSNINTPEEYTEAKNGLT